MKSGKIWGQTEIIEHTSSFEFHRIEFKANHCCSEHYHKTKWNGFYVESGTLMIKTWQSEPTEHRPNMLCDQTILRAGDYYKVEPGKWHQFVGVDDGVAFELYWAEFNGNDIVRRTQGQRMDSAATERNIGNPLTDLNAD
jgi:mannose-6-phosphate isomerase-like protein (cupin superfamily)